MTALISLYIAWVMSMTVVTNNMQDMEKQIQTKPLTEQVEMESKNDN